MAANASIVCQFAVNWFSFFETYFLITVTYCDNGFSDGNWALVRRVASGSNWHIATFATSFQDCYLISILYHLFQSLS